MYTKKLAGFSGTDSVALSFEIIFCYGLPDNAPGATLVCSGSWFI